MVSELDVGENGGRGIYDIKWERWCAMGWESRTVFYYGVYDAGR